MAAESAGPASRRARASVTWGAKGFSSNATPACRSDAASASRSRPRAPRGRSSIPAQTTRTAPRPPKDPGIPGTMEKALVLAAAASNALVMVTTRSPAWLPRNTSVRWSSDGSTQRPKPGAACANACSSRRSASLHGPGSSTATKSRRGRDSADTVGYPAQGSAHHDGGIITTVRNAVLSFRPNFRMRIPSFPQADKHSPARSRLALPRCAVSSCSVAARASWPRCQTRGEWLTSSVLASMMGRR